MWVLRQGIKKLASLNLAIFTMGGLGILLTIGTLVESKHDAWTANQLVWSSPWMYGLCSLLVVNLAAVIFSRYPWKARHLPFLLAHVGIIILVFGAYLTQVTGVEGRLRFEGIGAEKNSLVVREEELQIFQSTNGLQYEKVHSIPIRPHYGGFSFKQVEASLEIQDLKIDVLEIIPNAFPQRIIRATNDIQKRGAAIQVLLANDHTQKTEWIVQETKLRSGEAQIGPLRVTLGGHWNRNQAQSEIRLVPMSQGEIEFTLFNKGQAMPAQVGRLKEGGAIQTGWNGLRFQILVYHESAEVAIVANPLIESKGRGQTAIKVATQGQESYLFLNHQLKVFTESHAFLMKLVKKEIPLNQSIKLLDFKRSFYPGSQRASDYHSLVRFADGIEATISMNSPFKQGPFQFYQSSVEFLPDGSFGASILSVNADPGRFWKYAGALLMCLGIVLLFIFPRAKSRSKKELVMRSGSS
jgi:hypothetical protein